MEDKPYSVSTSKKVEIFSGGLPIAGVKHSNHVQLPFLPISKQWLSYSFFLSCGKQFWFVFSWPCNTLALNLVTVLRQMAEHHGAWQIGKWKHACSEIGACSFSPAMWSHKVHSDKSDHEALSKHCTTKLTAYKARKTQNWPFLSNTQKVCSIKV